MNTRKITLIFLMVLFFIGIGINTIPAAEARVSLTKSFKAAATGAKIPMAARSYKIATTTRIGSGSFSRSTSSASTAYKSGAGSGSMARLTTTHSASFGQGSFAGAWTAPVNTVTYPKAISKSTTTATKNVHKNSRSYKGETHVYAIRNSNGSINKIGESAQGTRVRDGASKRAEQQVRKLNREVGPGHTSEIRGKVFSGKDAARTHETNLIKRYRSMYGQNMLPGNKINR